MKILVADDDPVFSCLLQRLLGGNYQIVIAHDGTEAWQVLQQEDAPRLAILNWMMPGMDGPQVCSKVRATPELASMYLLLLTARQSVADIVAGLEAGADDYITKPFDPEELTARVNVGRRVVELQSVLAERMRELQDALARVKQLQGLLPICSYCKRIRNDRNYWQQLEVYFSEHSEAQFTHGVCPECYEHILKPEIDKARELSQPTKK